MRKTVPCAIWAIVDSVKISSEVRLHAGTRHLFIAYPIRVTCKQTGSRIVRCTRLLQMNPHSEHIILTYLCGHIVQKMYNSHFFVRN